MTDGMKWAVIVIVGFILFLGAVRLLAGPQNCGGSGVRQVVPANGYASMTVVCNNGSSFNP